MPQHIAVPMWIIAAVLPNLFAFAVWAYKKHISKMDNLADKLDELSSSMREHRAVTEERHKAVDRRITVLELHNGIGHS